MHVCLPELRRAARGEQQVWRAHFSAVSATSISHAMATLRQPNEAEASAVDARQELDLKVGVAFTRFLTHHAADRFKRLSSATVSYGPCQTPTLNFVVERHLTNQAFVPEPFWKVGLSVAPDEAHDERTLQVACPAASLSALSVAASAALPPGLPAAIGGARAPGLSIPRPPGDAQQEAHRRNAEDGSASTPRPLELYWARGRVFDRGVVSVCLGLVQQANEALVVTLDESVETRARPVGMCTVQMLKVCSKALGMGAQRAMQVAESLYMGGFLSYPRTESTAYPKGFDFASLVRAQTADAEWGEHAAWLLDGNMDTRARSGAVDAGDHPPITPMQATTSEQLSACAGGDGRRLYELVARTFLASLCPDATLRVRRVQIEAGGEGFSADGREIVDQGWYRVMPHLLPQCTPLPSWLLGSGQRLRLASSALVEGRTTAPGPITESELITEMERHGIGTDASIASHIGTIEARKFARLVAPGRSFEPTALGLALLQGIRRIDPELVQPTVRSHVEAQLNLIASGRAKRAEVVGHCLGEFEAKFAFFQKHIHRLTELLDASFGGGVAGGNMSAGGTGGADGSATAGHAARGEAPAEGKLLCKAAHSGHYLRMLLSPTPRLYDPRTEETWQLPIGGSFKSYHERRCPRCDCGLLLYSVSGRGGASARTYPLCAQCYSQPQPAGGTQPHEGRCSHCPHPEEHPIVSELALCACPETADLGGRLIIDPSGGPHWRLVSTRGSFTLALPPFVHALSVGTMCGCSGGCAKLRIDFQRTRSPLENGETTHEACILTDELIHALCESTSPSPRGGRAGGRGKGGEGGKGGGKGGTKGGKGGSKGHGKGLGMGKGREHV